MAHDEAVNPAVRHKCQVLFAQWAVVYKSTQGMAGIASLNKEFPNLKRTQAARQKVLKETDPFESETEMGQATPPASRSRATSSAQMPTAHAHVSRPVTLTPTASSFAARLSKHKSKHSTGKSFNLAKEKDNMTNCIARSSMASTNLLNALQLINRETEQVSQNVEVLNRFEACKSLRRQILLYIQEVESDDWIGSLVNANDELVKALTAFEIMDRSIDDDSDSDAWEHETAAGAAKGKQHMSTDTETQLAGLNLLDAAPPPPKPPRPVPGNLPMPAKPSFPSKPPPQEKEDDDPFGDSNVAETPYRELDGMTWKEV